MGDLQAAFLGQPDNFPLQKPQARHSRAFLALFKEDLQPQADAQKRLAGSRKLPDRPLQPPGAKLLHGIAKRAHPREHCPFGA